MTGTIFVQIASYRDPQLILTIRDCLSKAKNPNNVVFGICWQRDDSESLEEYINHPQFRIIDVPYMESQGVCWARNLIQENYGGEDYTLQIDSHQRFSDDWDETCIHMLKSLQADGYKKPLLTSYAPPFNQEDDTQLWGNAPCQINFDKFTTEWHISTTPAYIENFKKHKRPIPSRFFAGGFAFTVGKFCYEVPYDPNYYFNGEEIMMAIRAFTHGYDLFHPNKIILWHEYSGHSRPKHWDDHGKWYLQHQKGMRRLHALLETDDEISNLDFGIYGFGIERNLRDYEEYAGINFRLKAVQQYTFDNKPPPNPANFNNEKELLESYCCKIRAFTLHLKRHEMPILTDCDFWYVGAHNKEGTEIHRQDITENEINDILKQRYMEKAIEFMSTETPFSWTVWPHSKSKGWLTKITKFI